MRRRSDRGQSLVEVAFVLPVLLIILLAIFDFGRAIYAYNTVANSAREAARLAIVDQNEAAIEQEARDSALALDPADITVAFATCSPPVKIGCPATVTVSYPWTSITPVIGSLVGPIALESRTEMLIERVYMSP